MGEEVKTALLEAIYKLEQAKPTEALTLASQELASLEGLEAIDSDAIDAQFEQLQPHHSQAQSDPMELEL
jgi:hypothetical protein